MGGIGKTTAARSIARRYDLRLYSVDSYTCAHAERLPKDARSLDEIWVNSTPEGLAAWFDDAARARFPLILEDLRRLPTDVPILAEGPQLLPPLVRPLLASPDRAVFVVGSHGLHRQLLEQRGSGLMKVVRDPDRAFENRLRRDRILAERLEHDARWAGFPVRKVSRVGDTEAAIESQFGPALRAWDAPGDRGDVAERRREDNDARLRQWRANADHFDDESGEVAFAYECARYGCVETVTLGLLDAEHRRATSRPLAGLQTDHFVA